MKNGKPIPSIEKIMKKHNVSQDYLEKQLSIGTKIEHEHTKNNKVAMGIALQHLDEFPDYYTRLLNMEKSAKKSIKEGSLHSWFRNSKSSDGKPGWVNVVTGDTCASDKPGEGVPKCVSSSKRASMSPAERRSAAARKRKADPGQQEKSGAAKPTYVSTDKQKKMKEEFIFEQDKPGKGSGKKDACYHKVKSRFKVWPSAYASGALVKCRKAGAKNWGNKSEAVEEQRYCSLCNKKETRNECSYGPSAWDMNSVKEDCGCENSLAKIAVKLKKEKQRKNYLLNNKNITENYSRINEYGGTYTIALNWRNKTFVIQIFFPSAKVPTRAEVQKQIEKIYPNSFLVYYKPSSIDPAKPLLFKTEEVEYIEEFKTPAWQRKEGQNPEGGLNEKGRRSSGGNLKPPVTKDPSKLNPNSKSAKRRKSYCARSAGQMKMWPKAAKDPNSRLRLARKKWNC